MNTVFDIQSILEFHLCNHNIPKMTCCCPKLRTIRSMVSLELAKRMSVWAFHLMVPLVLVVLSTLYARMGLERHFKRKFSLVKRPMLMKFPVAPQSIMAVVSMI